MQLCSVMAQRDANFSVRYKPGPGIVQEKGGATGLRYSNGEETAPAARQQTTDLWPAVEALIVPSGWLTPSTAAAGWT